MGFKPYRIPFLARGLPFVVEPQQANEPVPGQQFRQLVLDILLVGAPVTGTWTEVFAVWVWPHLVSKCRLLCMPPIRERVVKPYSDSRGTEGLRVLPDQVFPHAGHTGTTQGSARWLSRATTSIRCGAEP